MVTKGRTACSKRKGHLYSGKVIEYSSNSRFFNS